MTEKHIELNGPAFSVEANEERPAMFMLCETVASTKSNTDEPIEIVRALTNPFIFEIRGEKLTGKIDLNTVFQEAILHVLRENAS